jgi:hypothetical protein
VAQIFFSQVGAAVGSSLLPNGIAALGLQVSGAAIGQAVGSYVGGAIDNALFAPELEGPRLDVLQVSESREGAPLPISYGRVRVPGQVIWATHFRETASERSVGGKGGSDITEYTYTASFAVALCEGELTRVARAWANGAPLALATLNHRLYRGSDAQVPDPLMEAVEGAGQVPAYRGTAYIVFEDIDLAPFGNRLPQLSFEVIRVPPSGSVRQLADVVEGVNLIPASGEFVYATEIVRQRWFPGIEKPENMNNAGGQADMLAALDQMEAELPLCRSVSMVVGWFGTGARAGTCDIRPGVETLEKTNVPWGWRAGGIGRAGGHLITRDEAGRAVYGGTPDDRSIVQGLREIASRGPAVTLTPFLFMDTPGLPWRGRLVTSASDGTAGVRSEIEAFVGAAQPSDFSFHGDGWSIAYSGPAEWSYRRFVLHNAWLAKRAGGVKAFLIGTEMIGLTRLRDEAGAFPFVDALVQLAADVKAILGPEVEVSYAADWTEYGAYVPADGSGDVLFPLDPLWASPDVDYVGIDWYAPMGDWRDGEDHLDALAGFNGPTDPAYLAYQVEGGEGYDWYYATEADRAAQLRTPIIDTAHGEDWIFRVKDIRHWRSNLHHERPGGVRSANPTAWQPGSKPVRFCEIGFPAVHRGTNQPNVFFDPKSVESALPHFSGGGRDDALQRAALAAVYDYWAGEGVVDEMAVWAWDARPFPDFPARLDVWSDGANWRVGHWLNGRAGTVTLGEMVDDLARLAGIDLDHDGLALSVPGYTVSGPTSLRRALQPLVQAFAVTASETAAGVHLSSAGVPKTVGIDRQDLVAGEDGLAVSLSDNMVDKGPDGLRLDFIDGDNDFAPGHVEVSRAAGPARNLRRLSVPMTLSAGQARDMAHAWLDQLVEATRTVTVAASPRFAGLAAGQPVTLPDLNEPFWVETLEIGTEVGLILRRGAPGGIGAGPGEPISAGDVPTIAAMPDLIILDLPGAGPHVAAFASPWPGRITVRAGGDAESLSIRAELDRPAQTGRLLAPLGTGPVGRWDRASLIEIETGSDWPVAAGEAAVLNGAGQVAIETQPGSGRWEVLAFARAEMLGPRRYRLSGLLRGLGGSDGRMDGEIPAGATLIALGSEIAPAAFTDDEIGLERLWRAGSAEVAATFEAHGSLPWRPAHLRAHRDSAGGLHASWIPRGADIPAGLDAPDPPRDGVRFEVRVQDGAGGDLSLMTAETRIALDAGELAGLVPASVSVAETGTDGRTGPAATAQLNPG